MQATAYNTYATPAGLNAGVSLGGTESKIYSLFSYLCYPLLWQWYAPDSFRNDDQERITFLDCFSGGVQKQWILTFDYPSNAAVASSFLI